MVLYHGSNEIVDAPAILITKYKKDFGWGFYTSESKTQAERWARRRALKGGTPTVSTYEYTANHTLKILAFPGVNDEWLDFIAKCRSSNATQHSYDIVSGPMADDEVWNYVDDFLAGKISREAFFALCKFKHPTQQTSFHTAAALTTLKFIKAEEV